MPKFKNTREEFGRETTLQAESEEELVEKMDCSFFLFAYADSDHERKIWSEDLYWTEIIEQIRIMGEEFKEGLEVEG